MTRVGQASSLTSLPASLRLGLPSKGLRARPFKTGAHLLLTSCSRDGVDTTGPSLIGNRNAHTRRTHSPESGTGNQRPSSAIDRPRSRDAVLRPGVEPSRGVEQELPADSHRRVEDDARPVADRVAAALGARLTRLGARR